MDLENIWKNKCRCCFSKLNKRQTNVKITPLIMETFFAVVQVELRASRVYSDEICGGCLQKLESFSKFKSEAATKQMQLYEMYPDDVVTIDDVKSEFLAINIKQEVVPKHELDDDDRWNRSAESILDNTELLRDSLLAVKEPINEGAEPKNKRAPRGKYKSKPVQEQICPDCGKVERSVTSMNKHWKRRHSGIVNYVCDLCGYGCLYLNYMRKHIEKRHIAREFREKFQCSICPFQSVNRDSIKVHEKTHDPAMYTWKCHCGKAFVCKSTLESHQRLTHAREYRFKCRFCVKVFASNAVLKEHTMISHIKKDQRDVICKLCSAAFIIPKQLERHIREHHSEGPLKCSAPGCPKTFHKNSLLNRHMLSHTKEKTYQCDQCPASYSHSTHLYRHQEIVHLGWKLHCEVPGCMTTFVRRDNYRNHLKRTHRGLEQDFLESLLKRVKEVEFLK